ncbi:hypothetical protein J5N97_020391 [Dioscorea zingiberensis]|uniref:Uncharacterized protein n=1 Tax=Dioscorea zingiberensis TaxID=325984 RepID=A0A9D5CGY2_9LILI|nr:hypothetical protein J5N97_020391 [Dioscorea zingiberensis]
MATERDDSLQSGYVSGTSEQPKSNDVNYAIAIDIWKANNAKIITWINNSVDHSRGTQLVKYETAEKCPKLRQQNQSQQQSQAWKPGNQSQSNTNIPPQGYKPSQSNAAAIASSGPFTDPGILAEQFQKFLSLQHQAMSASSSVGFAILEADWDRP